MALPVVTVASGGLAVIDVTATTPNFGLPVTEALNGYGTPVTKVAANGLPVTFGGGGGGGGTSAEVAAWLARATTLDAIHIAADTALIDGLIADGVWPKLDVLYIHATQNSATALLNMVSSSYNGTANGSPTFTVDRGFTGTDASTTKYINTGFNASTAPSPKFTQNSGHLSFWNVNDLASSSADIGAQTSATIVNLVYARFTDGFFYNRVNVTAIPGTQRAASANSIGHFIGNRTLSNASQAYKNGVDQSMTGSGGLTNAVHNLNIYTLGFNNNGTGSGSSHQQAMTSIGSGLTPTDVTNFYNRLRTRMTAVGVP